MSHRQKHTAQVPAPHARDQALGRDHGHVHDPGTRRRSARVALVDADVATRGGVAPEVVVAVP